MSRYRELADRAAPRPWGVDHYEGFRNVEGHPITSLLKYADGDGSYPFTPSTAELIRSLVNHADDIERLWKAADEGNEYIIGGMRDGEPRDLALADAVEALRDLFGDE